MYFYSCIKALTLIVYTHRVGQHPGTLGQHGKNLHYEIEEIKSTRKRRLGLEEALALCRIHKATLIVAKLDRLGRDVVEIASLVKSKVDVVVTDNPNANRFTIHILAAMAEEHRRVISENTKAALQAAKRKGKILGKHGHILAQKNKKKADRFAKKMKPTVKILTSQGFTTIRSLTNELNKRKIPTFRTGGQWHVASVYNVLVRLKIK